MTFHNEGEALAALMSGGASPEDLREIVTGYPHLRAAVTLYPATDTALLGWLSDGPFPVWWTLVRFAVPDRVKGS